MRCVQGAKNRKIEYDFSKMQGGMRGKYHHAYRHLNIEDLMWDGSLVAWKLRTGLSEHR